MPVLTRQLTITDEDMERFRLYVAAPDVFGCTLWTGGVNSKCYGSFWLDGGTVAAHRVAYEYEIEPIPPGLFLDHVWDRGCRSTLCVNTAHLEPVTNAENQRRAAAAALWRASVWVRTELDEG